MLALLIRVLLISGAVAAAIWAFRRWRAGQVLPAPATTRPNKLEGKELARLEGIARRSDDLARALELRRKIAESAAGRFEPEIAGLLRHLAHQVETTARIDAALEELKGGDLAGALDRAESKRLEAETDEARRLAEATVEKLVALRDRAQKLVVRRDELAVATEHILLELHGVHLAVLESTSSEELGDEAAAEIRRKLTTASEDLERAAAAGDEVARFLAAAEREPSQR